ncbi:hypothetical protein BGY98DRAFT_267622 [Russula aff. rugulosa BPL654]|nr:hypothetical protein BGY98DRAFT_267622 [Russula aff. rugulosa BPL654]
MRWTCLSLVAIRPILADSHGVQHWARQTMESFATADETGNDDALVTFQKINETIQKASHYLFQLFGTLWGTEDLTEEVIEILRGCESQISELEQINIEADRLATADRGIFYVQNAIYRESDQIISQFPGVLDDFDPRFSPPIPFSRFIELSNDPRKLQFICPAKTLKTMCSPALTLRNILGGQRDTDAYKELLKNLCEFQYWQGDEMRQQLWRLQDLRDGGGLGFTVELFFLALSQLLSTPSSRNSHSALYTGTFRAITSDWRKHKDALGTQNLPLYIVISRRDAFADQYPDYIVDELLLLLGNIFEGQTGPHIDRARELFGPEFYDPSGFRERVLRVLTSGQA